MRLRKRQKTSDESPTASNGNSQHVETAQTLIHTSSLTVDPSTVSRSNHAAPADTLDRRISAVHIVSDVRSPHAFAARKCPHLKDAVVKQAKDGQSLQSSYDRMTQEMEQYLSRFPDGQLRSFSWNLATCVPTQILGSRGIITLKHPSLDTLSIINDPTCGPQPTDGCSLDLSAFHKLTNLTWKGLRASNLDDLTTAIQNNAKHMQRLELDLIYRWYFRHRFDHPPSPLPLHIQRPVAYENHFYLKAFGLGEDSHDILLPVLRELVLAQAHLSRSLLHAINFDSLEYLTLRLCHGWDTWFDQLRECKIPIRLKRLEIHESEDTYVEERDVPLRKFIMWFDTLEELYLLQNGPISPMDVWDYAARRHRGLKRFVYHQRELPLDFNNHYTGTETDVPDSLNYKREEKEKVLMRYPTKNPLKVVDLEFFGVCCLPKYLKPFVFLFTKKDCLKVLHLRQSARDMKHRSCWGIRDGSNLSELSDSESDADEDSHPMPILKDDLRNFVEWVFGPKGIKSLQTFCFGDFSPFGRNYENNFMLCRDGSFGFKFLKRNTAGHNAVLDKYGAALMACRVVPQLECCKSLHRGGRCTGS